jgi:hypothetical protein
MSKTLATCRKTTQVASFLSKFLLTLPIMRASCSVVLCLGRNPNCSSRSRQRSFTPEGPESVGSCSRACQKCPVDLQFYERRLCAILSCVTVVPRERVSTLVYCVRKEPWLASPARQSKSFCWRTQATLNLWIWSAHNSSPCDSRWHLLSSGR